MFCNIFSSASKPSQGRSDSSQDMVVRHGNTEGVIDVISGEPLYHFNGAELASMSVPSMITLFLALLTASMAILGSMYLYYYYC